MTSFTISQKRSTAIHNGQRWGAKPNIPSNRTAFCKRFFKDQSGRHCGQCRRANDTGSERVICSRAK